MSCSACGHPMAAGQRVCPECGARRGLNTTLLASLVALLALVVIAGILSALQREAPRPGATPTTAAVVTPRTTPTRDTPPPEPSATPTPTANPSALAGAWVPVENVTSSRVLHLAAQGEEWVGGGDGYLLTLRDGEPIEGTLKLGESALPVTATLASDRLRLEVRLESGETEEWSFARPAEPSDPSDPRAYLPALDTVRVLSARFADDTGAEVTSTASVLRRGIVRSELESVSGEPRVIHFVWREGDGLYRVDDVAPDESELWLPSDLEVGRRWTTSSYECEVVEMGKSVDLGFETFPCLVVKRTNPEVQVTETACYAPGLGEVLVEDDRGFEALRLKSVTRLEAGGGRTEVEEKASNLDSVNAGE